MKVTDNSEGREAIDRVNITLGSGQEELVKQVFAANPKTVVVLVSSFPYAINWAQENVPAIVHMAHSSQEMGNGLADVLFGDYNPAGPARPDLAQVARSIAAHDGLQHPPRPHLHVFQGRAALSVWLRPELHDLRVFQSADQRAVAERQGGSIDVSVDVKNTGTRAGDEVVQLYVKHIGSAVDRPNKELRGFKRVPMQAGETKTVTITLPASRLAYWNAAARAWVVENDKVQLMVGASSADTKLDRTIDVTQ